MGKIKHRLFVLMAENNIRSLRKLSADTGIEYRTLQNFSSYVHKKLDPMLIATLCEFFGCTIGELLYIEEQTA